MPHSIPKVEKASRNYVPFWTADNLTDTKEIPTYLFRLTAPATNGTTTDSHVCPPDPRKKNLLDLRSCDAANRLYRHLEPVPGHENGCNFMSWSSSILFLIQYAFYRSTTWWTDENFNDIKLLVIDTGKLPKGVFVKDLDLLRDLNMVCNCDYHQDLKSLVKLRNGDHYFGEYLTQGSLDLFKGECMQVNFQEMVDLGLFELLPAELKDERNWTKWAKPVVWSRHPLYYQKTAPSASEDEVHAAISIAKTLFRGPWSLPVATMLLGLKPRQRNDPVICNGLIGGYGSEYILTNDIFTVR